MSPINAANDATAPPFPGGISAQGAPQAYVGAFERFVPKPGFLRIDITVAGGDFYLQISESLDRTWEDPAGREMKLAEGAHSIPLVRWAFGWRVRSASPTDPIEITSVRAIG